MLPQLGEQQKSRLLSHSFLLATKLETTALAENCNAIKEESAAKAIAKETFLRALKTCFGNFALDSTKSSYQRTDDTALRATWGKLKVAS